MKYSQLGNSGLIVPRLTIGTMLFGGEGDFFGLKYSLGQDDANNLIARALDAGINFFDTANMYNSGKSEEMLAQALGKRRGEALISTKLGFRAGTAAFEAGISAKQIVEQCEKSLNRLSTDHIDVLSLHVEDPITPIDEISRALEILTVQGKIRYSGVSNFQAWKTGALAQVQRQWGRTPIVSAQMHYSLLNRSIEEEFIPMARHYGIGLMVWSPLSSGFLTGKYTKQNPKPEGARLNTFDLQLFDREKGYGVVEVVAAIAKKHSATATAVSLAWLLSKPTCSTIIVGVSNLNQLADNLAGININLDADDLEKLDTVSAQPPRYPAVFMGMADGIYRDTAIFR